MEDDENSEEVLQEFVQQWRKELHNNSVLSSSSRKGEVEGDHKTLQDPSTNPCHPPPAKRPGPNEVPPLLVLPGGDRKISQFQSVGKKDITSQDPKQEDLVGKLISDLDETNTIPFFDIQLPREIALIIFSYLDIRDLCTCALVSKSWNSLAEDDVLWHRHYIKCLRRLDGKRAEIATSEWKSAVQELLVHRQQVLRNWKERICGLSDYQPDDCRVLCCLGYSNRHILSCYSSGALKVWSLASDRGPARVREDPGPHVASQPTSCCAAYPQAAVTTADGCLKIVDLEGCSLEHTLSDLGAITCLGISCRGAVPSVGVAYQLPSLTCSRLLVCEFKDGEWLPRNVPLGQTGMERLTKIELLPMPDKTSCSVLCSSHSSLSLQPLGSSPATDILGLAGEKKRASCVSCFQCDDSQRHVACGGYNVFGHWVQLFDLAAGNLKAFLKGHAQVVTSISFHPFSPHTLVTGSADKHVRVYDCRSHSSFPSLIFRGHSAAVRTVQMDQWKVISGSSDGTLIVWDTRMSTELWRIHERHSVEICKLDDHYLICGHIPVDKNPIRVDAAGENPNICHRRLRGLVRVMDFSVDPLFYTRKFPSICSSTYNEPAASSFNLDLIFPYDDVS